MTNLTLRLCIVALCSAGLFAVSAQPSFADCGGQNVQSQFLGTPDPDTIHANDNDNVMAGLSERDELWGEGGADNICGDGFNDRLLGDFGCNSNCSGDDRMFGDGACDYISGNGGSDAIHGETDSDTLATWGGCSDAGPGGGASGGLVGGEQNDDIYGGDGSDYLNGYTGAHDWGDGGNGTDRYQSMDTCLSCEIPV